MRNKNGIGNDNIIISKKSKNDIGSQNKVFETVVVKIKDLPYIVTQYNYSLINWIGGQRNGDNFKSASGFIVDIDEGLTIDEAQQRLDSQNLNYIIIPSRSHTAEAHKFHILLFFSHPIYASNAYEGVADKIKEDLFPELDTNTLDGARFAYGSPKNFPSINCFTGENYNTLEFDHLWTSSTEINTAKGGLITAYETNGHTSCYCLFHEDSNPSAFIDYSEESENYFIHCSACNHSYWMLKDTVEMDSILEPFWSYKKDVYQMGIMGNDFYFNPIGFPAFHTLTNSESDAKAKKSAHTKLIRRKHIPHITRIDYRGDINAETNYHRVDASTGIITVNYAPISVNIEDNEFIEKYLEDRFGSHMQFIKEYLSVFSYTNYTKLPTLVFNSSRGNGKSTFAELIGSIYWPLWSDWTGIEGNFNYESEKKFLLVEENTTSNEKQYKTLKKYMGQTYAPVNKKYKDPYKTLNNMSIAVLSNKQIPMFVRASEIPTDEANNQFFVWEFPELSGDIDSGMGNKLQARIGHYIRTELKTVYVAIEANMSKYRYSINVPITEYETAMFKANITDVESDANDIIYEVCNLDENGNTYGQYYEFIADGFLPIDFVNYRTTINYKRVLKNLIERKYLSVDKDRPMKDGKQYRCYLMTKKFREKFTEVQKLKNK